MVTWLIRYYLSLTFLDQIIHCNSNHLCSDSSCHSFMNRANLLTSRRVRRAIPAQCTSSPGVQSHTVSDSFCCDPTFPLLVDRQLRTTDGIGAVSHSIQQRMQLRFNTSFEAIISESDFVLNTYYSGARQCKFETDRYFVVVYETPVQYDISDTHSENFLASFSSRDPLGWKQAPLAADNEDQCAAVIGCLTFTYVFSKHTKNRVGKDPKSGIASGTGFCGWNTWTRMVPPAKLLLIFVLPIETAEPAADVANTASVSSSNGASVSSGVETNPIMEYSCSWRNSLSKNLNISYTFSGEECCDARLSTLMKEAALRSEDTNQLGDSANYYHGRSICKIYESGYHYLAYETPIQYDVSNLEEEEYFASFDADEPLGSTKSANVRGSLPDVRVEPTARDDTSVQPEPSQARVLADANAGAAFAAKGGPRVFEDNSVVEDENKMHVGGSVRRESSAFHQSGKLPSGTHCNKEDRAGDKCCSGALFKTMSDALYELSSSPLFSAASSGNIASLIQNRAQRRFQQSFEVIVSTSDFALASYGFGDQTCKYQERGFTIAAYSTPRQYNINDVENEEYLASISASDDLGATQPSLPGQRPFHTPLKIYSNGDREGFPVGSHCNSERAGSKCCSLPLYNVMQSSYISLISRDDFDLYDLRRIARAIQYRAEGALRLSFEVFISTDDFASASAYAGNEICKYRVDRYHIMAYASPVQYPIHSDIYDDSGPAIPVNCPEELEALEGEVCCDGELRYEINRAIDKAKQNRSAAGKTVRAISREISGSVQKRFGTTFETIVSHADFTWRTHHYSTSTCKIDSGGYHALTYESSKAPPPEFAPAPPMQLVEPVGGGASPPFFGGEVAPLSQISPPAPLALPSPPVPAAAVPAAVNAPPVFASPAVLQYVPPAVYPSVGGGGPSYCFSTDTWVTTPDGKKRMDDLKVGDFVLTADLTTAYYAPISFWIHRAPNVTTKFVTIMTDYGKMLALSGRHFIFRNKCEELYNDRVNLLPSNSEAVYAEQLEVGDCVYLLYKDNFRLQKLQDISITERRGIYSPLTSNGRIIVNDMLASCYSDVNEATLQTTYFSVLNALRKSVIASFGNWVDQTVDLPFGTELLKELLRFIVPLT